MEFSAPLVLVLLLILGAEFVNGWTDAPNAIATVVSTRSLGPYQAVVMAAIFNLGGVLSGTAVARTIGTDIIDARYVDLVTVGGAMVGIIIWSTLAAYWGIRRARATRSSPASPARGWRLPVRKRSSSTAGSRSDGGSSSPRCSASRAASFS